VSRLRSRLVEGGELDAHVDAAAAANRDVLAWLAAQRPSCHDEVGEALLRSAERCGEWVAFSPSFASYRYIALVTARRVFALGLGQRTVAYRLPAVLHATALQSGGAAADDIGSDWVRFELFRADHPAPDLDFWTLKAYAFAREAE
jgi:hypothetical protein